MMRVSPLLPLTFVLSQNMLRFRRAWMTISVLFSGKSAGVRTTVYFSNNIFWRVGHF